MLARLHFHPGTLRALLAIAFPMIVSQGAFAVMTFTDRLFMSRISAEHMAASLGGGVAFFFTLCFFIGLISYANALVAQYLGAQEEGKCSRVVTQAFLLAFVCQPLLWLIAWGVLHLFTIMGHEPGMVVLEKQYYLILMFGAVLTLWKAALSAFFAGIGRTRVVMVCDVAGLLLNVPLCWAMAFGRLGFPALGIAGAAYSTLIATAFSLGLFIVYYLARDNRLRFVIAESWGYFPGIMRRYLRLGLPSGMELFLNVAAFNLFLLMFQSYGVAQGAAASIVFSWDMLSFIPMLGLNIGVVSLIGRSVGARQMENTNAVMSAAFLTGLVYSGLLALVFIFWRFPLVEFFRTPDADFSEIRTLAAAMMIGLSCYTIADALIQVSGGVLRGAGDTRWVMIASTLLHWLMLVVQFLVIKVWAFGALASWWVFCAMILSIAAVFLLRLASGRWRHPDALARVMQE